ncbi:YqcC family protein [Ferruginibacter sp.]
MIELGNTITAKTMELEEELKATGLWQTNMPAWVHWYDDNRSITKTDFAQWLQFVFIPNHLHKNKMIPAAEKNLLVPHAIKYFGTDVKKGKLLQILIEIDALL